MSKYTILNVTNGDISVITATQKHTMMQLNVANNVEQAIEKLHHLSVSAILVDETLTKEDIEKICTIGKLSQPQASIRTIDFANEPLYRETIFSIRKAIFKQKMEHYQFEDNPNLNNPFLNLNKTNIFNN